MNHLKKFTKKLIYGIGVITTISLIGVLLFFIYIKIINPETTDISFNDGPHLFYLNDSTLKSVEIEEIADHQLRVHEKEIGFTDSVAINQLTKKLFEGFNPTDTFCFSPQAEYTAGKIAVVSDIHGSVNHFSALLKKYGVSDNLSNWNYSNGHLVIVGDVLDKGPHVTECLWLIKKLETQAKKQGGEVHLLLGNHERLVINGVSDHIGIKYEAIAKKLGIEYQELYGPNTYLGRWLRTKKVCVKINNNLFTHGGISKMLVDTKLSAEEINQHFNTWINSESLMRYPALTRNHIRLIKSNTGPMEYRGYFNRNIFNRGQSNLSDATINSALEHFNADHIIVGHTIVKKVKALFNNRVIAINIKYADGDIVSNKPDGELLLIEGANYYRAPLSGEKSLLFAGNIQ
jgi:hypothetical protein